MSTAEAFYQSLILDRSRAPRFRGALGEGAPACRCRNPLCGDDVTVEWRPDATGAVAAVGYVANGCAILIAASDLMAESVLGLDRDQALSHARAFQAMLGGGPEIAESALAGFAALRDYPARLSCASLPWQALESLLGGEGHE